MELSVLFFKAYLCLGELFPSVNAAEKAVEMRPCWWMAYQTLGRAHLGLGEVRLVSIYYHIFPHSGDVTG